MISTLRCTAVALCASLSATTVLGFDLQGHRGARGLAPENTLAGFSKALAVGVTTLELDVGVTKDGVLVVHHDRWLNPNITRGPDGQFLSDRGPLINALTVEDLRRYDVGRLKPNTSYAKSFSEQQPVDGQRIPTLESVFKLAQERGAENVRFNIETKLSPNAAADTVDPETFAGLLAKAIRNAGLTARANVQSFDWRTLKAMQRIAPEIARVCLTSQSASFDTVQVGRPGPSPFTAGLDVDDLGGSTPRLVAETGCSAWSPAYRDLTPERIAEARALRLQIVPWTVNEPADMERLIGLGVDGIITDYPDRLRKIMAGKDMALPPAFPAK